MKPEPEKCIIINQPVVRNFSTGGGHGPEDTLTEGDLKLTIKKWQGYPPDKCCLIGKPVPAMPEVMIPRRTGRAEYATRVHFPNMLICKMLGSPHPRALVKSTTIYEPPDTTNVFINSWEPCWFFGSKGFAETAIGAPPGALANAIYNACGVRIREHPVTKDAIMAGLKASGKIGVIA